MIDLIAFDADIAKRGGPPRDIVHYASLFAFEVHRDQRHANEPYARHCERVANRLEAIRPHDREVIAVGWLHDVLEEDPSLTHTHLVDRFGRRVADYVEALTGRGPNRRARNADWMRKLVEVPDAIVAKVCDRLDNAETCWRTRDGARLFMYHKEQRSFSRTLRPLSPTLTALWTELDAMLDWDSR